MAAENSILFNEVWEILLARDFNKFEGRQSSLTNIPLEMILLKFLAG